MKNVIFSKLIFNVVQLIEGRFVCVRLFINFKKYILFYNLRDRERERVGGGERRDYNDFVFLMKLFEMIFNLLIYLCLNYLF